MNRCSVFGLDQHFEKAEKHLALREAIAIRVPADSISGTTVERTGFSWNSERHRVERRPHGVVSDLGLQLTADRSVDAAVPRFIKYEHLHQAFRFLSPVSIVNPAVRVSLVQEIR